VRPPSVTSTASAESGSGRGRKGSSATATAEEYRRWQDLVEVSSRDADDEDEDEDDESEPSPPLAGVEPVQGDAISSPLTKKTYKMRGVQTPSKVFKHQSVQVPYDIVTSSHPASRTSSTKESKSKTRREHSSTAKHKIQPQATATPEHSPVLSPQVPELSPPIGGSQVGLKVTNETYLSPPSSLGPSSPPEITLSPSSTVYKPRPARRTFDPARGVDVFKKGSEDVLTRFLKLESWEEKDSNAQESTAAI
jgi:hypothetical protein